MSLTPENQTISAEDLFVSLINNQARLIESFGSYQTQVKNNLRSLVMQLRVCLANTELGSDNEQNLQAVAAFVNDLETWAHFKAEALTPQCDILATLDALLHQYLAQEAQAKPAEQSEQAMA